MSSAKLSGRHIIGVSLISVPLFPSPLSILCICPIFPRRLDIINITISLTYIWISMASHFSQNKALWVTCPLRLWIIWLLQHFLPSSPSFPSVSSQHFMLWLMIKVSEIKFNLHSPSSKTFYDLASVYLWLPCKQPKSQPHLAILSDPGPPCPFWLLGLCYCFSLEPSSLLFFLCDFRLLSSTFST